MFFYLLQLFFIEATGIDDDAVYFIAFVFTEVLYAIGGIEASAES
jgi:hypothetical protein